MNNAVKIISGIIAVIIFLNIPVKKIVTLPSIQPIYSYNSAIKQTLATSLKTRTREFIYHKPLSGNYTSSFQYEVTKLGPEGIPEQAFIIPDNKDILKSKKDLSLIGKDGYLTYPSDGSFYLWYPRLGNQTLFYDKVGEFLWSHQSTHYMKAFPSGDFILSMTGDHSRAFFMLPNLSILGSTEGTLLINYQFPTSLKNKNSMQLCLGYIDGDIVFYNPQQKHEIRISSGVITKSIACNFEKLSIAIQNEDIGKKRDEIRLGFIESNSKNPGLKWKFIVSLPDRYVETLPIGIHENYLMVLIPVNNTVQMLVYDIKGKLIRNIKVSDSEYSNIEEWRIYPVSGGHVVWNTHEIGIYNPDQIFRKKMDIENVVVENNVVFIQTPKGVISYLVNQ